MAYVIEKKIINDVQAPRWLGYGGCASHALLVADGAPVEGVRIKAVCGTQLTVLRLQGDSGRRCKRCTALCAERKTKANAGLSERQVDAVHTGAQQGAPREAELKVAAAVAQIGGEASKLNAESVAHLRKGNREAALESARMLDEQGPAAPVPSGPSAKSERGVGRNASGRTAGQRGEARMNGVAMTPGGVNLPPVQPMRRNKKTRELEVSSRGTMGMRMSDDRPDTLVVGRKDKGRSPGLTRTQRRREARKALRGTVADLQRRVAALEGK